MINKKILFFGATSLASEHLVHDLSKKNNIYNISRNKISGLKNISLREAINFHCKTNISARIEKTLKSIPSKPPHTSQVIVAAEKQRAFFAKLSTRLNEIENQFPKEDPFTNESKQEFVKSMKLMIQYLLGYEEATLLLQNYDYSGFSIWNQRSSIIMRRKKSTGQQELLEEEFLRDRDFLRVLKGAINFNINVFGNFVNKIQPLKSFPPL